MGNPTHAQGDEDRAGDSADAAADDSPTTYRVYMPIAPGNAPSPLYDMTEFMIGDGRLYEVMHSSGSQARHQTQTTPARFFHTKGNEIEAEWEELWSDDDHIYRGTDTSPGSGNYYTLYEDGVAGSPWSPRHWRIGDVFERRPYVVFYRKSDCQIVVSGYYDRTWLRFEAFHDSFQFEGGITLDDVVELTWLRSLNGQPEESYFYARDYGLVGWGSAANGYSYISEIHQPGQRPDNTREVIGCIASPFHQLRADPALNFGPLPPGYTIK